VKTYSPATQAALAHGGAIVSGAVYIDTPAPAFAVWGGYGDLEIEGVIYTGIAERGLAQATGGALGDAAQNVTLTLSGLEPSVLALLDEQGARRAAVVVRRLIFDVTGRNLLDWSVYAAGRLDHLDSDETIGAAASLVALVESAAKSLGRSGGRMRTDADQRLISPTAGGFSAVSYAGEKVLAFGGKPPVKVSAVAAQSAPALPGSFEVDLGLFR
jgi:hypothetical protein